MNELLKHEVKVYRITTPGAPDRIWRVRSNHPVNFKTCNAKTEAQFILWLDKNCIERLFLINEKVISERDLRSN